MKEFEIIEASRAEEGKDYLLILSPKSVYKMTVLKINSIGTDCSSVTVKDERYPTPQYISGASPLVEFDEEFYISSKNKRENVSVIDKNEHKKTNNQKNKENTTMARTKSPRSQIIDQCLANVIEGQEPNWQEIVDKVVESGRATADDAKKVTFQAKLRYKWYQNGQVNPAKQAVKAS